MVSCNLLGRMANQMFTISAVIGYSLHHDLEYHIPAHTLNDSVWKPMFTHLENPNWNPALPTITVRERGHQYQEIGTFDNAHDFNIIIDGYRQSLKYFEDYLPEVRKAFGFDYTVFKKDTVALHHRLGDYKLYPTKHTIVPDIYFEKSLAILKDKGYSKCIVFSDSIDECEEIINSEKYPGWEFEYSKGKTELEDFQIMLQCGSFVISASTYSLMAAILSESEDKVCISPSKYNWFGPDNSNLSTETIIPDSFIQIKY